MNRIATAGTLLLLLLACAGCTPAPPPAPPDTRAGDQKAIAESEAAWIADWKSKDVEKIVSHYTDDAVVMLPEMPALHGKAAIRANVKSYIDDPNVSLVFTPTTVEAAHSGELAYVWGTYTMTMTNPKTKKPVTEVGKYASIYRKQANGSWKVILDIDNTDAPAK
jgi:uncharacterized protein (TIGR02246 family)